MSKISGVYLLINILNNKVYVGSSLNINKRIKRHFNELRKNIHYNLHLQNAFNKYGESSFKSEIIEKNILEENIIIKEQFYINKYDSHNFECGYNICEFAYTTLGYKHSEDTKKKMSFERKNNPKKYARYGKEHWNYGNKHSEDTKNKMCENHVDFKGEKSSNAKLTEKDVLHIRKLYENGNYNQKILGLMFNVNGGTIGKIVRKERWTHI